MCMDDPFTFTRSSESLWSYSKNTTRDIAYTKPTSTAYRSIMPKSAHPEYTLSIIHEMVTHLSATWRGSCCGTQSSTDPAHSGNTEWRACRPLPGTRTPCLVCRSRRHAAYGSLADLQNTDKTKVKTICRLTHELCFDVHTGLISPNTTLECTQAS